MGIKVVTPPATEPVTLAEAKLHLRVDTSDEDALISRLISAAREQCEQEIDRSVAPQTLMLLLDAFPAGAILLPRGPVASITSVQYVDAAGALQTVSGANYTIDDAQIDAWLLPAYGYEWPAARDQANAVRVTYQSGYTACPEAIRQWILLAVGTMYATREADSDRPAVPQNFAARLLDRYRVGAL
jgi:uncharacterized phiE125 gp8 family phage protein